MMCELRKLFLWVESYDIKIMTLCTSGAANIWADALSRVTDYSDWHLAPRKFKHLSGLWGPHTVDRFASFANKQMLWYNAKWRDGTAEAVDCLHLTDGDWRGEHNWYNPLWESLDDLVVNLRQCVSATIVIAPY
jgi:hypothetical protein